MDEKNLSESEEKAEPDRSPEDDSAEVGDLFVHKNNKFEGFSSKSESITSKSITTFSDDPSNDDSVQAETEAVETDEKNGIEGAADASSEDISVPFVDGSEEIENEIAEPGETAVNSEETESAQTDRDGEDFAEKDARSGSEDKDVDVEGPDTDGKQIDEPDENDSSSAGETEEDGEPPGEEPAFEEMDQAGKTDDEVGGDTPPTLTQTESETVGTDDGIGDPAREAGIETPAKKRSALKVTVSVVVIAAVFSGFFFFDNQSKLKKTAEKASGISHSRKIVTKGTSRKKTIRPIAPTISSVYHAKIEAVTALRNSLLLKQEEIKHLKKQYRDGIEELEKEIWDESRKRQCKTFSQAMENDGIAFALRTIQRKQAYIQQLEKPSKWIHQACEELLYIKRRTRMDLEVAEIVAGIDINQHVRRIDAAVRKYQPDADKLAPEMTNPQLEPLETIWERIRQRTQPYAPVGAQSKNRIISEQICAGDFDRITELSEISGETARCISEMQTSDLFLNNVTEISPGAARQLIYWKGSWICLNGVRALSPRAAHYLFQWGGSWISLNGLNEFPVEIGESLLQWEGRQLELMGLQYTEDFPAEIAFEYLARWERTGGKLFVPQSVRKKIDEIHKNSI